MTPVVTALVSLFAAFVCVAVSVPPAAAAPTPRAETVASAAKEDKVDINHASVKDLMSLDGVGHKLAEKIVEYRDAHGPFRRPEDLRKVEGIGGALWEKNRERIVVK